MFDTKTQEIKLTAGEQAAIFRNNRYERTLFPGKYTFKHHKDEPEYKFVKIKEETFTLTDKSFTARNAAGEQIDLVLDLNFRLENLDAVVKSDFELQTEFKELSQDKVEKIITKIMTKTLSAMLNLQDIAKLQESLPELEDNLTSIVALALSSNGFKLLTLSLKQIKYTVLVETAQTGILFKNHKLDSFIQSGKKTVQLDPESIYQFSTIPISNQTQVISNQEVLTSDNIALRFSYHVTYRVVAPADLVAQFELTSSNLLQQINEYVHLSSQVALRNQITAIKSSELNANRQKVFELATTEFAKQLKKLGIELVELAVRDITFPKMIQDVFAELLAAEVKAVASLEEARAKVAAARAEKNAAEIIRTNPEMKFTMLLHTLKQMSEKGRHTFNVNVDALLEKTQK